jgi:hypothetical protein
MGESAAIRAAVVEVTLDVRVTVKLEAERATPEELSRLVERDPETVRGAILRRVCGLSRAGAEAGWLDDERCAFVTEVIDTEQITSLDPFTADPKVTA